MIGRLGFRGTMLVLFGIIWTGIGIAIISEPTRAPMLETLIPQPIRAGLWVASGFAAIYFGTQTKRIDAIGWTALYIMPALRSLSYFLGWVDFVIPWGGDGIERGWLAALIYLALVAVIVVCARWPDPPPPPNLDDEGGA
jgi:hypothetical protein